MNEKSLGNLRPRKPIHSERKGRHEITVTPTAWAGLQDAAAKGGCSVSELIERLGRGTITLDGPQGDVLIVERWGNVHCKARDALGNEYACKRVNVTP